MKKSSESVPKMIPEGSLEDPMLKTVLDVEKEGYQERPKSNLLVDFRCFWEPKDYEK